VSVFVGRVGELETLAEVVAAARSGGASAAVVIGEPGSGKSRLVTEARAPAGVEHSLAVVGYEPERNVPLAAAAGLLRALTEAPGEGARLEALLWHADDAGALDSIRVFEAVHRAFRGLEPALLVIDDLQWLDDLSYALCHYLIRAAHESEQRVAVFAATRPHEKGWGLVDALPSERITVIQLAPLSAEEGVELALALDPRLDPARAAEVCEQAQGLPFWVEALVRGGASQAGRAQLLTSRLRGAGADAGTMLGLLAVAGRPVAVGEAAAILGWPLDRSEAALHDALEHRRAAEMPSVDLAVRLVETGRRALLGLDGLRLLGAIADEADPFEPHALVLQEGVAALATELAAHEEAIDRWSIVAERAGEPAARASALLAASKAAFALERVADAREFLVRAQQIDAADDVVRLEQRTQEAAIRLWLEQQTGEARLLAREAARAAARLAARSGGAGSLEGRARRAYVEALRLDADAALQEGDAEAMLRAAQKREAAARGLDAESYLTASLTVAAGLRLTGNVREATARLRRLRADGHRHVLPRLAVDAG
jgi:hypothetical protein